MNASAVLNARVWPRTEPILARTTPPVIPESMPTVAEVKAMDVICGCPAPAKTSPRAADVPNPPDQEANSTMPMPSEVPIAGPSRSSTNSMPTTTCPADMSTPYPANPASGPFILVKEKDWDSAMQANTTAMRRVV